MFSDPFYPVVFLFGSSLPRFMDIFFKTTFYSTLLFFWISFFHGIRQTNRSFTRFYSFKLLLIGLFWFSTTYVTSWSRIERLEKPTLDEVTAFNDSSFLRFCSILFYSSSFIYALYLLALMLAAFTELRCMPYFEQRIKLQGFMISITLIVATLIVVINFPAPPSLPSSSSFSPVEDQNEVSAISFLQLIPWTYEYSSSASFLAIYSMSNLYVYLCAYFYYPATSSSLIDSRIVRDNPTLSMINNDSDEEILYTTENDQQVNLNQIKLVEPAEDEESD